jgi:electron transfer flavoprotein alpha subunit
MKHILYLANSEADGSLSRASLEALQAAVTLSSEETQLTAGLVGENTGPAAQIVAGAGIRNVLTVSGEEFSTSRYSSDVVAFEGICKQSEADVIIAAGTSRLNRVLPGVAYRLDGRIDTHVCDVSLEDQEPAIARWYYRQRMRAVLKREQRPWMIVVDPGSFQAWEGPPATAEIVALNVDLAAESQRTSVTGFRQPSTEEQTIRPEADLLFVAGAGWTKTQADGQPHVDKAEELILGVLKKTQASLGGSKSSVEITSQGQKALSFMSHLNQVGQTGSTPRHPKGLATCCHGEEPHVVGWRFINDRRAVNLDPNCGWAQGKADVLYVADAFEVVQKIIDLME